MKWCFIVFCVYLGSLFFREQRVPGEWVERVLENHAPDNLVFNVDSLSFGFLRGLHVRGVRIYDSAMADPTRMLAGAESVSCDLFRRDIRIVGLTYTRLPDSYYAPGNQEKNARVECEFPDAGLFTFVLERPDVLGIRPDRLTGVVRIAPHRIDFSQLHLTWPEGDRTQPVNGFCYVDLDRQEVYGEVDGHARQVQIRPLLEALDVPVAFPYFDGFTDVPEPCRSWCAWKVDLVRNDFDLWLDLHPALCRYNTVPMAHADGKIHLHNYTRGTCLNYKTTVGPIVAKDVQGRGLEGTVTITGTNGYNVVDVRATSAQPLADVLKIGGFTGDYVGSDVFGDSECALQFRFPRAMTNNYELLDGCGHLSVRNGQLMRMKGFRGEVPLPFEVEFDAGQPGSVVFAEDLVIQESEYGHFVRDADSGLFGRRDYMCGDVVCCRKDKQRTRKFPEFVKCVFAEGRNIVSGLPERDGEPVLVGCQEFGRCRRPDEGKASECPHSEEGLGDGFPDGGSVGCDVNKAPCPDKVEGDCDCRHDGSFNGLSHGRRGLSRDDDPVGRREVGRLRIWGDDRQVPVVAFREKTENARHLLDLGDCGGRQDECDVMGS